MLSVERQALIAALVRETQLVKVADLMARFDVSDMTVRRDLDALEKQGVLRKVYGGAVLAAPAAAGPDQDVNLDVRAGAFTQLKMEIARRAADLIAPDDVIILDAGTTTLALARMLPRRDDLVIVTNSIPIAHELAGRASSLLLAGGIVRSSTHSAVGPKTKEFLSDLRASKLFLGASSLSLAQGLMNSNLYESEIKQTMMAASEQVIVLADSSKFESKSYHVFAQWKDVDILVTDHLLPDGVRRGLSERGVQVLTGAAPGDPVEWTTN